MTRKWLAIASVVLLVVSLAGCVTDSGYYDPARSAGAGALGGAATGAAVGSIIGAASGHAGTGAWVARPPGASWVAWAGRSMPPTATARSARARPRPRRITTRARATW